MKQRIGPLENKTIKTLTSGPKEMADILQQQYVKVFSDPDAPMANTKRDSTQTGSPNNH